MTPSDAHLGATCEVLSVRGTGTGSETERDGDLHGVRPADSPQAPARVAKSIDEGWKEAWLRSRYIRERYHGEPERIRRAAQELEYCVAVRDAKAAGVRPPTWWEVFGYLEWNEPLSADAEVLITLLHGIYEKWKASADKCDADAKAFKESADKMYRTGMSLIYDSCALSLEGLVEDFLDLRNQKP